MKYRLLYGIFLFFACSIACVLPPPIEEGNFSGINLPPYIDTEHLTPDPTRGIKQMNVNHDSPYLFEASVYDPNEQDLLYYRVFINYHLQNAEDLAETPIHQITRDDFGKGFIQFSLDASRTDLFQQPVSDTAYDLIELMVSDRAFETSARSPAGRIIEPGGYSVSFTWMVHRQNLD